jgi:hypothetical protein
MVATRVKLGKIPVIHHIVINRSIKLTYDGVSIVDDWT